MQVQFGGVSLHSGGLYGDTDGCLCINLHLILKRENYVFHHLTREGGTTRGKSIFEVDERLASDSNGHKITPLTRVNLIIIFCFLHRSFLFRRTLGKRRQRKQSTKISVGCTGKRSHCCQRTHPLNSPLYTSERSHDGGMYFSFCGKTPCWRDASSLLLPLQGSSVHDQGGLQQFAGEIPARNKKQPVNLP